MLLTSLSLPPSAAFWPQAARALLATHRDQLSALRVIVPAFSHAQLLKAALAQELGGTFIPPRINTLSGWLALQLPDPHAPPVASDSQRLMTLYDSLRQQAWLKKLFSARRNADLLPLAQTLLTLSDELTQALLPGLQSAADAAEQRWQAALAQLSPPARSLLSDESQLVWSVWKSQLDANDTGVARFAQMMQLAVDGGAGETLIWINPAPSDAMESAFLAAYGERQTVWPITLDWRSSALPALYCEAWRELAEEADEAAAAPDLAAAGSTAGPDATRDGVSLMPAASLEDEAQQGAQTIINWLQAGKSTIAIVAQDRVVSRRIRALLERAEVVVSDETGWKLSTTRAAAAFAAWFEVIATRAETVALLDVLKSPFLFADLPHKTDQLMTIELALRRANVAGGWEAVQAALANNAGESVLIAKLAGQAAQFANRRSLPDWIASTRSALDALGMTPALAVDPAGAQTLALLAALEQDCCSLTQAFSFPEWRAFINLQLEATPFVFNGSDRRVVMLPLNGARLRNFDAVLMVGSDAAHLPSQPVETLFFANAVRRELGLATRESRQHQQLRDFTELLCANAEVVLSWQAHQDGEPNPVSPWIERLQLALARSGAPPLPTRRVAIDTQPLTPVIATMPTPAAPQLAPAKLSASAYNSFVTCPYQFFAARMLRVSALDELSDMPEKRDYGGWLHRILNEYHSTVRDRTAGDRASVDREQLLRDISAKVFDDELDKNAAALGFYVRWQKVIPAYLDWANAREQLGWQFVFGEQAFEKELALEHDQGVITLHGRIDRIDQNADGERAVLDYKTNNLAALKAKLKDGEDHQLPFYGLLSDVPVAAANYVALELTRDKAKDKTGDVEAPHYADWQNALQQQIVGTMSAVRQGAPLPANGVESVCQYCDVRGLCRKGAW